MNKEQVKEYKQLLLEEKKLLQSELNRRGRKLAEGSEEDWIAVPEEDDGFRADQNENADDVEDFEANVAVLTEIEQQYVLVVLALDRIEKRAYGICTTCHKEIEEERLRTVPTATNCIEHKN